MDKLKPFAIPLVALALLVIWYFAVRPRLDASGGSEGDGKAQKTDAKSNQQTP